MPEIHAQMTKRVNNYTKKKKKHREQQKAYMKRGQKRQIWQPAQKKKYLSFMLFKFMLFKLIKNFSLGATKRGSVK